MIHAYASFSRIVRHHFIIQVICLLHSKLHVSHAFALLLSSLMKFSGFIHSLIKRSSSILFDHDGTEILMP